MPLVPHRFLFRVAHPCRYLKLMPIREDVRLLDLSAEHRIENFAGMDEQKNFAEVCLAWNEFGIGLQVEVRGKQQLPVGNPDRPRGSDGVTIWLDTRDSHTSHRGSRHCHQFHALLQLVGTGHRLSLGGVEHAHGWSAASFRRRQRSIPLSEHQRHRLRHSGDASRE